ncbi:ATG8/AUT7/APG8/PAZ2 putative (ATG8A.2) [Leptomonas pyrrhocoris]|uniref:ATG8/AUT7/APG8/PAZ2 putative (ATG8A.2) n=1 Tax=Leptomonas pyrrhocoris TaxID=157538 RepID=A0A0N0DXB5_LEPPY|nr:ATG8/AUT7/APG8/PAZ2 putative (ATG8A.2) [Leptomonas pyrrhocoris]XP_015661221.1 ATG8/AUT7/APG8/PAZ2 putative (ATG8A.2) [Leptomonas pyrrhocoris]XP_015661223.1 ATG8/AUT7/APG8/PAZ2 putative (ATG8A.2) [Leptomonas pyrrhocoris]XP_015661224.1 ATG8/AUT7/APG8/PAZ2 putative (ATG8A.2) [Leptomonas pyrrhocoris]XP_015661227.1 ATG8/AUT7/APG8/PAZ2 putative (ATG8A.2) [Leptomonas pyrrhocoris]XP_015661228.1 ATG8/AUT7/APG8/PAZ2 putative (ATG8A.2) [Leptomonas pyrrhocoris]XP_015661230.1 ATG8/AUT7/APG8/PAZ2 putati|eukprot:XP_015661220.1 ATG8/AUT7/APG8/PAZ2 putative (ATG8A.2) [Leptomonas pyrrhocoris]
MSYAKSVAVSVRTAECRRLQQEHPNEIPVVMEGPNGRVHFLTVPHDATAATLEVAVRSAAAITGKKLGIVVRGCSPAPSTAMADLYDACRCEDGFLYVAFRGEGAMGARNIYCVGNTGRYLEDIENNPDLFGSYTA